MKYPIVTRRENNIYYRRRNRAIGSHSRRGVRNPNGLSHHVSTESIISAGERKRFLLPCGRTIAQSWAALRKCWLAFYITKSQGDTQGMTDYAYRIRKIQAEMGIKPTDFDSDILDENTVNRIDMIYRKSPPSSTEAVKSGEESAIESNDFDYAQIMNVSNSNNQSMPAPRQEIFSRRDKSCPSPAYQSNANVEVKVPDYENSCYLGPPEPASQSQMHVKRDKTIYKKQCQAPPANHDNFAVSDPENTLAVPNPNQPPILPILRGKFCGYPPAKGPPRSIREDKSCEYDPQVNQMQKSKKEKDILRRSKSCPYTSQI
jgi:hypothetical protein